MGEATPQPGVIYYLDDHLGSVHLITDSLGNVLHEESRYPYGLEKASDMADNEAMLQDAIGYGMVGLDTVADAAIVYAGQMCGWSWLGCGVQISSLQQ